MNRPHLNMSASLLLVGAMLLGAPSHAAESGSWRPTPEQLQSGRAEGIAISERGELFLAPALAPLERGFGGEKVLEIWSMVTRDDGSTWIGTGPEGRLFSVDGSGVGRRRFDAPDSSDSMITALLPLDDGTILIGTSPQGRIYRLNSDGTHELFSETGERYIWQLRTSSGGNVYAATGPNGRLLRLRSDGSTDLFFDADEPHLVDLAARPSGGWIVGGGGRGRIYFVDRDGHGWVAYDDELDEARAISPNGRGGWYVCLLASPAAPPRAAEIRLQLPRGGTSANPSPTDSANAAGQTATLLGQISEPESGGADRSQLRGRIVELDAEGATRQLWDSYEAVPLSSAVDAVGHLYVGTTEPAALYRLDPAVDGRPEVRVSRLATFAQGQVSSLNAPTGGSNSLRLATSHPAQLFRLGPGPATQGQLDSAPFDAGTTARWGQLSWSPRGRLARTEFYTRTGNSPLPDESWSGWSAARVLADGSPFDQPDGRWAQWRLRFVGAQATDATLSEIHWPYRSYNRAPRILSSPRQPRAIADELRLQMQLDDPDRDPLRVVLEHRKPLDPEWQRASPGVNVRYLDRTTAEATWDLSAIPEGEYEVRWIVSDAPGNHPGEQLEVHTATQSLRIDRSAPTLTATPLPGAVWEVVAADANGQIARLELRVDDEVEATLQPVDGVCDSARERFRFNLPQREGRWSLQAIDAAGNRSQQPLTPAPAADSRSDD